MNTRGFLLVTACACAVVSAWAEDASVEQLRMNQLQVVGTHNSYHVKPGAELLTAESKVTDEASGFGYTHAPLDVQLDRGVRSLELDVHADRTGTKVFHVPVVDTGTTCSLFVDCLRNVRAWSEKHPQHTPVLILVETKEKDIPLLPEPLFDAEALDQMDKEIRSVLEPGHLLVPDAVRKDLPTLSEAVQTKGWPTLKESRGKFMLVLHARGRIAQTYTQDHPSLEGRAMFMESQPGKPYAAVFIRNNPDDGGISELLHQGYIVRTRADADIMASGNEHAARRDIAFASGAQVVSTDYPAGEADPKTGYDVRLPGGMPVRCNPITAPGALLNAQLETP